MEAYQENLSIIIEVFIRSEITLKFIFDVVVAVVLGHVSVRHDTRDNHHESTVVDNFDTQNTNYCMLNIDCMRTTMMTTMMGYAVGSVE